MLNADKKIDQVETKANMVNIEDFYSPNIPKSFQLGGLKIDVRFQEKLTEKGLMLGAADYVRQEIRLDPTFTKIQTTEQAYLHELTHWILFIMGESELCNNEKFVDVFAHFLYQALITAEPYPPPTEENEDEDSADVDFSEVAFPDEEECEILDYMEEAAAEEEHYLACQETGREDKNSYEDGMALSDDEGWFYGDGD